jgi:L-serine/L-threonine ammonia-lyase
MQTSTLHHRTPMLAHHRLSRELKKSVWLKMENTQPSGSFKMRGLGTLCQRAAERGARHFVCPSGGNAGFAAAMSGVALGVKTTILVPETTGLSVRAAIQDLGAELVVIGDVWDDTNQAALAMSRVEGAVYIPPFDHPDIWDGNATLIDEAAQEAQFDVVICSVGGGGLLAGVVQGLQRNGLSTVPVIAVETEGAASFHAAVQAGEVVTLAAITTIATTLGSKRVAQRALDLSREHPIHSVTVTDRQATDACVRFADDLRTLVEPACGAALAVAYENFEILKPYKRPLIVVCGGIAVDLKKIAEWKST